jgi:hypothetical protein
MLVVMLLTAVTALDCPVFKCADIESDMCAFKVNATFIEISQSECDSTCNFTMLAQWNNYAWHGDSMRCLEDDSSSLSRADIRDTLLEEANCPPRMPMQSLVNSAFPLECFNSTDCLLEDGSFGPCVCGLDGKSYCMPSLFSSMYDYFWEYCADHEQIIPFHLFALWMRTYRYSVQASTIDHECIDTLTDLKAAYFGLNEDLADYMDSADYIISYLAASWLSLSTLSVLMVVS